VYIDFMERIVRLVAFDIVASTLLLVLTGLYTGIQAVLKGNSQNNIEMDKFWPPVMTLKHLNRFQ